MRKLLVLGVVVLCIGAHIATRAAFAEEANFSGNTINDAAMASYDQNSPTHAPKEIKRPTLKGSVNGQVPADAPIAGGTTPQADPSPTAPPTSQ